MPDAPRTSVSTLLDADVLPPPSASPLPAMTAQVPPPLTRRSSSRRVGSLTQDRELAQVRAQQKRRLLRMAEREAPSVPRTAHRMTPGVPQPITSYVQATDEPKFRELYAVLRKLKQEWGFLLESEFNPVSLSLALLPQGALHSHAEAFASLSPLIESSLQGTLDDHYDSFATAITVNHGMIASLGTSQDGIASARQQLQSARDALGARRADLVQMWQRMQSVKEATRVLSLLEQLRGVPDELESLMTEKRFLEATQLLMRSLRLIQRDDLAELGATSDLRAYLRSQEHALLDILIEELQSHLYLKSYWCDGRWRAYVAGQDTLPDLVLGLDAGPAPAMAASQALVTAASGTASSSGTSAPTWTTLQTFLRDVHARRTSYMDDATTDPLRPTTAATTGWDEVATPASLTEPPTSTSTPAEDDSFLYLEMLCESLARLGKIGYALDTIAQLVPTELHQLIDTTLDEVEARHASRHNGTPIRTAAVLIAPQATHSVLDEPHVRRSFSQAAWASATQTAASTDVAILQQDRETMRDFFYTLFSKLEAVLAAHRALHEVAGVLIGRASSLTEGAADRASAETGVVALSRVWDAVQDEVQGLLMDYLANDAERVQASHSVPPLEAVLRSSRYEREKAPLFRLAAPSKMSADVRAASDALEASLHVYVPGLVGQDATTPAHALEPRARFDEEVQAGHGHRRLVPPMIFVVAALLAPTHRFLDRVSLILPRDAAGPGQVDFTTFLRGFVHDAFLPQLGEQVHALVQSTSSAPDAFQPEAGMRIGASRAVMRSAVQVATLVDSLYAMLQAAPFQRASYTRLIVLAFLAFYEKCNDRFKRLVAEDPESAAGPYALSIVWVQRPELYACLTAALDAEPHSTRAQDARHAEAQTEWHWASSMSVRRADLITSRKRHMALGTLQHSLHWLSTHMHQFAMGQHDAMDAASTSTESLLPLPASSDVAALWQDVPRIYTTLCRTVLMTLRVELRLKTLYYLHLAIQGNYVCDALSMEPDTHVVDLNAELAACHETYKSTILPEHYAFVFDGLDVLMDLTLTRAILHVPALNRYGVTKMLRNLLSLQQNLKNIAEEPRSIDMEKSRRLWDTLAKEPEAWLAALPAQPPHSAGEYLAAIRLCLGLADDGAPMLHAGTTQQPVSDTRYRACVDMLHQVLHTEGKASTT